MGARPSLGCGACRGRGRREPWSAVLDAWRGEAPEPEKEELEALKPCQVRALLYIRRRCAALSRVARPRLLERALDLGYSEDDLEATLAYIREQAPIIVHVDLGARAADLAGDTHYRNMFEARSGVAPVHVQSREEWERRLFRGAYDGAEPFDRCKYGVLNPTNDPVGVSVCAPVYGSSYLLLQGVRLRTTLSAEDSAGLDAVELATLDSYAHVLARYTDAELCATLEVGTRRRPGVGSHAIAAYKEAQVHGEIRLRDHVAVIMAHPSLQGARSQAVERLAACCGAPLVWIDAEDAPSPEPPAHAVDEDLRLGLAMSQEHDDLRREQERDEDDLRRAIEASLLGGAESGAPRQHGSLPGRVP